MVWTYEQNLIMDAVQDGLDNPFYTSEEILVDAKAGCSKSTIAKEIVKRNPSIEFMYTAFNKKIVEDGVKAFGKHSAKTFHAFAYKHFHTPNIGGFYANSITESLTYNDKKYVVDTLNTFCLSKYADVYEFFEEAGIADSAQPLVIKYLELMSERKIKHTFDYMLKEIHMLLVDKEIVIKYDLLILDEAQDLTPVVLALFDLVKTKVTLYLGDTSQDIYTFLNLVSAFDDALNTYELTKSFRLSKSIAKRVDKFCKKYVDKHFHIEGVNTTTDKTEAFITHSNAEIIYHVVELQSSGNRYSFTRPIDEIFEVAITVQKVLNGEKIKNPKYWTLAKLVKYSKPVSVIAESEELDDDIKNSVKLINIFRRQGIDLNDVLQKAIKDRGDNNYLIGTAHSVKGLERGTVTISKGLNNYVIKAIKHDKEVSMSKLSEELKEEARLERITACKLYYVAVSRCKNTLINAVLV